MGRLATPIILGLPEQETKVLAQVNARVLPLVEKKGVDPSRGEGDGLPSVRHSAPTVDIQKKVASLMKNSDVSPQTLKKNQAAITEGPISVENLIFSNCRWGVHPHIMTIPHPPHKE